MSFLRHFSGHFHSWERLSSLTISQSDLAVIFFKRDGAINSFNALAVTLSRFVRPVQKPMLQSVPLILLPRGRSIWFWHLCKTNILHFSFTDNVISSTVSGLSACTKYSIELGAGPYVYRPHNNSSKLDKMSYQDEENESVLLATINKIWSSEGDSFRAFASTLPVSWFLFRISKIDFD